MQVADSPYPAYWYGTDLEAAGLRDVRPDIGTYGRYSYDQLPPVPFDLLGGFEWLEQAPPLADHIGTEKAAENPGALTVLRDACRRAGLTLPISFDRYLSTPALWSRVRSCTDCYLDLCPAPVPDPEGTGYLVRFLSDSQSCLFWYLYLRSSALDHAIVASPDFYGVELEQWHDRRPDPKALVFCAESFEAFMARFWLENEIWFAGYDEVPLSAAGARYVAAYKP
ncbi:MAG: hypothetical protein SFV24_23340 [Gemmatimonadales bacterium]|nr:hypothetical protein [Gemmatimonadales bacterium]